MFLEHQPKEQKDYYERLLKAVGSLSKLFSESPEPYLVSRVTENLFCRVFKAENLSRSDVSADASKDRMGFGIKTFLEKNGKSMQKVAEFNGDLILFNNLSPKEKIIKIAELRNERLETTKRIFGLDEIIYHCITRQVGKISIFETPAALVDINAIKNVKSNKGTIMFSDGKSEYSFSISKSTLSKRFVTKDVLLNFGVEIMDDPFVEIEKMVSEAGPIFSPVKILPHVFLPLYSVKKEEKFVPERSGPNQWNAKGRIRKPNEAYIQVPAWIHKKFPNFFPNKDNEFHLTLPDRRVLSTKICQAGSKALMSNPNADLGKWLLRDVLNLKEGELLNYEKLQKIGLDSVVVYKIDKNNYDIDFAKIGSYDDFYQENKNKEQ